MKKFRSFLSKYAFWIFQIVGCAAFAIVGYFIIAPSGVFLQKSLMFLAMFLSYFLPSTILRFLYKRFVCTDPFEIFELLKIIFFLGIIVVLGKEFTYYMGFAAGWLTKYINVYGELKSDFKSPMRTGAFQYVSSLFIYLGWTIFYFAIKEVRKYNASKIERLKLKDDIRQANLNTLKGHLNPQFMISSLHTIKELMSNDISFSRNLLTKLSEVLRYSLTKNNINSVFLEEELEIVKSYVDILNLHDAEKFQVVFDISSETLKNDVPPMLLTNLMELATRHGILMLQEGGRVMLISKSTEFGLEIKLVHNGKISKSKETELIEKTIIQRLKLLFQGEAKYSSSHELNATTHLIKIPVKELA